MQDQALKREHFTSLCRMCDNRCGINVFVENGTIVEITGLNEHRWNKGRLCVKGRLGVDLVNAPDRILTPLKRTDSGWQEIALDQAYDEIVERITTIQSRWGDRAMSVWKGEALGFLTQEALYRRFIHAIGSPNYFSNDSGCYVGRWLGYALVTGDWATQDFIYSKCAVIWASNPPYSQPNLTQSIFKGREKGGKLIVIDVRLSAIARQADLFVQIRPGTDGALALGLARQLIENDDIDHAFIDAYTIGFAEYSRYVREFTPERVERETGVAAETMVRLAREIGACRPKVSVYAGNGLEHHENGINNIRAIACLDGLLGNFDQQGGNFLAEKPKFKDLTLYGEKSLHHLGPIGADKYPALYDYRHECHTMTAMDTLLTEKPYPLKGMILAGANPVLTNPNSNKVIKALKTLDLLVVRELFMTDTAALADYVLPAATFLENSEFHCHPIHQTISISRKIVDFPGCDSEFMFLKKLAKRLGKGEYFPWRDAEELNRWMLEGTGIQYEEVLAHPEGLEYAPRRYQKYRQLGLDTKSRKFEFVSEYLRDYGYSYLPEYVAPAYIRSPNPAYPFVMVTGARKVFYTHGRNRNFKRCITAVPHPEIEMHPADAHVLGVCTGDMVTVSSPLGSVHIPVKVVLSSEILPGVTQVTHGWRESNINLIIPDDRNDPVDGFPLMKSVEVKIEPMAKHTDEDT
jgi:anaerobic selenocysteine-containing dehydrogenase